MITKQSSSLYFLIILFKIQSCIIRNTHHINSRNIFLEDFASEVFFLQYLLNVHTLQPIIQATILLEHI